MRKFIIAALLAITLLGAYAAKTQWHTLKEYVLNERSQAAQEIYNEYYTHLHTYYLHHLNAEEAHYYADYYANWYAEYYTSEAYQTSLTYALPQYNEDNVGYSSQATLSEYHLTPKGIGLIKHFEGFRAQPYLDAGGKMTIGYGHLMRKGEVFNTLSTAEAERLLRQDIALAEAAIKRLVNVPLTQNQFSALVSLVFNIGPTQFSSSTLLKKLNMQDYSGAAAEFPRWTKVGTTELEGLVNRRYGEQILFLRDDNKA